VHNKVLSKNLSHLIVLYLQIQLNQD